MKTNVSIDDTAIPEGVTRIASALPVPENLKPGDEIILQFGPSFLYLTGLVLLATWRKSLPQGITVSVDDSAASADTRRFLTNTGFREIIQSGAEHPSVPKRVGKVPLRAIAGGLEKEATINEIVTIFDEYGSLRLNTSPLRILLSELCENALEHSQMTTPGYICARLLERRCEIGIADAGIGIKDSFLGGSNKDALAKIRAGQSALEIAIAGLSSSKTEVSPANFRSHYGYGLYITRRLVEENRGRLTLLSGNEILTIEQARHERKVLDKSWRGTFVGMVLDLYNDLPLDKIYGEFEPTIIPKDQTLRARRTETVKPPTEVKKPESLRLNLSNYGTQVLTRELGTAIRADLATLLASGKVVSVDLNGVEDITPSCADEAFGKLAETIGFEDFDAKVTFTGGPQIAHRLIRFVLQTRQRPR